MKYLRPDPKYIQYNMGSDMTLFIFIYIICNLPHNNLVIEELVKFLFFSELFRCLTGRESEKAIILSKFPRKVLPRLLNWRIPARLHYDNKTFNFLIMISLFFLLSSWNYTAKWRRNTNKTSQFSHFIFHKWKPGGLSLIYKVFVGNTSVDSNMNPFD